MSIQVNRLMVVMALFLIMAGLSQVAVHAQESSSYQVANMLPEENRLFLIEYHDSDLRCYGIRTYQDESKLYEDNVGTSIEVVCNNQLSRSTASTLTEYEEIDRDTLYLFIHPTYGDVCVFGRTEMEKGDADVTLDCTFAPLE